MTKRDGGTEPGAQHCPNLTSQLIVFSVGYQLNMTGKKGNDVAYEIITVNCQEKLAQACSLDGHRTNGNKPCADALYHSQWNIKQQPKSIPVAFRRSIEMQTAGVQKGRPEDATKLA